MPPPRDETKDVVSALTENGSWLRAIVRARISDPAAVDDIMQEIALAAVKSKDRPQAVERMAPWLYRVAIRQILLYRRTLGRRKKLAKSFEEEVGFDDQSRVDPDPLEWLIGRERQETLRQALAGLSPRDREILMLKHGHGWTYKRIADSLGIKRHTVEYRLLKARNTLRQRLMRNQSIEVSP